MTSHYTLSMVSYKTGQIRTIANIKIIGASKNEIEISKKGLKGKWILKRTADVVIDNVAKYHGWHITNNKSFPNDIDIYADEIENYQVLLNY